MMDSRKRRSGPVRSGSVRRSGLFWVDRIGPVFGKIDRTEPDRHVSEKYEFFNNFLDIFGVKSRFYFLKLLHLLLILRFSIMMAYRKRNETFQIVHESHF